MVMMEYAGLELALNASITDIIIKIYYKGGQYL